MHKHKKIVTQIIFFGVVGVVSLLIDLSVTMLLYRLFNFPAFLASGIGFLSAFFFNFPMNRKRVFHHSENDRFRLSVQVVMFIALTLFNLFATSIIVEFVVNARLLQIGQIKIVVTALIAFWNFILFKYVIFSKTEKTTIS